MQRGERVIGYPSDLFQGGATGPTLMDSVLLHLLAPRRRSPDTLDVPSDLFLSVW